MKKILSFFVAIIMSITLTTGCKNDGDKGCSSMSLEKLNEMLNDSETMNMNLANAVAVIPFDHINGPRNEWDFYAIVNFKYKERTYVKYQVTYLSCTCRAANVNYWQTAYVEISLPSSKNANDATLRKLSFDKDGTDHYTAGFWGDSSPIYDEATGERIIATYEKTSDGEGGYYPSIKEDYIPLLIGHTKADFDSWSTVDDLKSDSVMSQELFDSMTGASVSTNNIIRILKALFKYHSEDSYFAQ